MKHKSEDYKIYNVNDEKYITQWVHTKWLVLSSFFFIIPSTYAYINKLYSYSVLLLFTSLISANYWRKATYSWRRNMDLTLAKISFVVFASDGILYVRKTQYVIFGYTGLIVLLYFYYLSGKLLESKKDSWYKFHFMFHFILTCEQIIIIDSVLKNTIVNF
jgi:glucose-6-phosphate-specific signal transduction histidine kinase